jgi:antitoxin (DNA-binding transcriptional repressor) of toxin-antitoxin stability system
MKTLTVGKLKANFSQILEFIKNGEEITIEFGKKHEKIAVIIPYKNYKGKNRKVGILKGKASFKMNDDFKMTDEEFFSL